MGCLRQSVRCLRLSGCHRSRTTPPGRRRSYRRGGGHAVHGDRAPARGPGAGRAVGRARADRRASTRRRRCGPSAGSLPSAGPARRPTSEIGSSTEVSPVRRWRSPSASAVKVGAGRSAGATPPATSRRPRSARGMAIDFRHLDDSTSWPASGRLLGADAYGPQRVRGAARWTRRTPGWRRCAEFSPRRRRSDPTSASASPGTCPAVSRGRSLDPLAERITGPRGCARPPPSPRSRSRRLAQGSWRATAAALELAGTWTWRGGRAWDSTVDDMPRVRGGRLRARARRRGGRGGGGDCQSGSAATRACRRSGLGG